MTDFRVILSTPNDVDSVGYVSDENGIEAAVADNDYLLSDGRSLVSPMPVFDAGGPTWLDSRGHLVSSIPLNLSGVTPPVIINAVTNNGENVTNGGEVVTNGAV